MIKFDAVYYDGVHPVSVPVVIHVTTGGQLIVIGDNINYKCDWQDIQVSNQLGKTARSLILPSGAKCESYTHAQINQLVDQFSASSSISKWINLLESKWRYVLTAAFVVFAFTWSMITFGIPGMAHYVAYKLPVSFDEKLSEGTLALFDERILEPSCLADTDKQRIEEKFNKIVEHSNDVHNYQLLFRRGLGANAFALPSGEIVITDELIALAESDEEILAVLTHEIGHVVYKHGLRNALQASAVALLITVISGDIGAASGLAATLPVILLQTNYSRKFEHEADDYAFDYMRANNIDTRHFATILQKITGETQQETREDNSFDYLSTHPMTTDRIERFFEHSHSQ